MQFSVHFSIFRQKQMREKRIDLTEKRKTAIFSINFNKKQEQ